MRPRGSLLLAGALALLALAGALCLDPRMAGPAEVAEALAGGGDAKLRAIVLEVRLPRVLAGFLVGALLGVAGALFQALLRNDLAEPYLIGVGPGAFLGVTAAALAAGGAGAGAMPSSAARGGFAFLGAVAVGAAVFVAARRGGRFAAATLLLAGLALGLFVQALATGALYLWVPRWDLVMQWLLGNLALPDGGDVALLALVLVVVGGVALARARDLDALALGEDAAWLVGVPVPRATLLLGAAGCLMAAVAVATAGLIGFVGLVVPHLGRRLFGAGHGRLLPASALLGGGLLVLADAAARTVVAPREIPAGLVTAALGAPVLLLLVRRR